ncbi:MAG TPA: HDOD domain-containing protein [Pirellulales bacterium]|nr:HDOD domain-containing protein [Pirellulales bacterium]
MARQSFRALVVDDDAVSRQIMIRAATQVGGQCDTAAGGREANELLKSRAYDVVLTDLRMPEGNGHALCVELLERRPHPVLVVLTGVTEPRLVRDLLARGVDDVMFKPINCHLLAAKVDALLEKARSAAAASPTNQATGQATADGALRRIEMPELEPRVLSLAHILPISPLAIEVARMAHADATSVGRIASAISRDPTLSAELLRLANSPFYNPAGQKLVHTEAAVMRVGTKRVGELAMGIASLGGLSSSCLSWMDTKLAWRRSLAAGFAAEKLAQQAGLTETSEDIFLSALLHGLGRVVLSTAFPQEYQTMIGVCAMSGASLVEVERGVFPEDHTDVLSRLLEAWKVPASVYQPLRYVLHEYKELARIDDPLRTKVGLVKTAIFLGECAVRGWEPWSRIEIPPVSVVAQLDIRAIPELLREIAEKVSELEGAKPTAPAQTTAPRRRLAYCLIGSPRFDFLGEVVRAMGIELVPCPPEALPTTERALLNCLGVPAHRLAKYLMGTPREYGRLIATDKDRAQEFAPLGTVIGLPDSFGRLRKVCEEWALADASAATVVPAVETIRPIEQESAAAAVGEQRRVEIEPGAIGPNSKPFSMGDSLRATVAASRSVLAESFFDSVTEFAVEQHAGHPFSDAPVHYHGAPDLARAG